MLSALKINNIRPLIEGFSKLPRGYDSKNYYGTRATKSSEMYQERFADPTYDDTFRRLFGEESNKRILINVLNSFLDLEKKIVDVEINNPFLEKRKLFGADVPITGAIDILCTTNTGKKIAVEMQRQKEPYLLAREQEYMSKLISGQVKERESKQYHNKVLDTYIIVISKKDLFTGNTSLKDNTLYEIDVAPTICQTKELYPGNKMNWKFFELNKFEKHQDSKNLTQDSPLKHQFLDFLLTCSKQYDIPDDRSEEIRECYQAMDMFGWNPDERTLHWKNIQNIQSGESLLEEERSKGKAEGRIETAKKMIASNIDSTLIESCTGLDSTQISKIRDNIGMSSEKIYESLFSNTIEFASDNIDVSGFTDDDPSSSDGNL